MLEIRDLCAWYGQAQALFGVSLTVGSGELVVLQGLNGAGKSTLLQAIMGLSPRIEGKVSYQNESILELPTHQRALRGLGYVPEDRRLFTALTVRENLLIAARQGSASVQAQRQEHVLQLFPALKGMLSRSAAHMSGGEQQMLAIARTLMAGPSLLLLDEPAAGLRHQEKKALAGVLRQLRGEGVSILLVEHDMDLVMDVCDHLVVMEFGTLLTQGTPEQIQQSPAVRAAYLGTEH
jgi:ABC-type branched-subunit amino acid transport system ATPase component